MIEIPQNIKKIISHKSYTLDDVGKSDSKVICFDDMVLKIEKQSEQTENQIKIMGWLENKLPVPRIICVEKKDNLCYLLMSKIEGSMLFEDSFMQNPKQLVKYLAEGLNMLWNIDISNCPVDNSIEHKLVQAENNIKQGFCSMDDVEPETYGKNGFANPNALLKWLKNNKPNGELVFSHGDYCLPNIFVNNNKVSGFIDLGSTGIADKYQDIALCYRSLDHNSKGIFGGKNYKGLQPDEYNPDNLFIELGMKPDREKIKYYFLLDELF